MVRRVILGAILLLALTPTLYAECGDIAFVTVNPPSSTFAKFTDTFANHLAAEQDAPRGGDLWIRYSDGTMKNLTQAAGLGMNGFQGANAIAVRDPAPNPTASKLLFSMVVGSATQQYQVNAYNWQLYEMTGIGKGQNPVVTKVAGQPDDYNNINPIYGSDGSIIFVSDRPHNGDPRLYPQLDEYESTPTNTGIWKLNLTSGELILLDHAVSGAFEPILDSFGRIIFTRWDHLQRDQQADAGRYDHFNYVDEVSDERAETKEIYPEPRDEEQKIQNLSLHTLNQFFPWMVNQDGTGLETLNHIGRHELHDYFDRTFTDDSNLDEFIGDISNSDGVGSENKNRIFNLFHIVEHTAGRYCGIDAPEFATHAAGQIVCLENAAPGSNPDEISVTYLTHRETSSTTDTPTANHSGFYRDPIFLSNGTILAAHSSNTQEAKNAEDRNSPQLNHDFRLRSLKKVGQYYVPDAFLTSGISKNLNYWDPDEFVTRNGTLWEFQPVELCPRQIPPAQTTPLPAPEQAVLSDHGVAESELRDFLRANNLALIVSRDVTTRDINDRQQPFNLQVFESPVQSVSSPGKIYNVAFLQLFAGLLVRDYNDPLTPPALDEIILGQGRRPIAQFIPGLGNVNPVDVNGPKSSVSISPDGSVAAFVPARRALTWQLTDQNGNGVVRERYWVTFQPGEIAVCTSCHGINTSDQLGRGRPENKPIALGRLLQAWKENPGGTIGVTLALYGQGKGGKLLPKVKSPGKAVLKITGTNEQAKNADFVLQVGIDGVSCPAPAALLLTDSSGQASLKGKIKKSLTKRKFVLDLSLKRNGTTLASESVVIRSGQASAGLKKGASKSSVAKKDFTRICQSFSKFKPVK